MRYNGMFYLYLAEKKFQSINYSNEDGQNKDRFFKD